MQLFAALAILTLVSAYRQSHNVGARRPLKNCESHIDASHSRQPLVKGERLVRYEVNAVMLTCEVFVLSFVTQWRLRLFGTVAFPNSLGSVLESQSSDER